MNDKNIGLNSHGQNKLNEEMAKRMSKVMPFSPNAGFNKQANFVTGINSGSDFTNIPLLYTDPLYDPILFLFPKDRIEEINKRLRHYYETEPIVGSAIDLHTNLPISDFYLSCSKRENQVYWNNWKDRVGLIESLRAMVYDYWLLGESIAIPSWDQFNMEISHFVQIPPENIDIYQSYVSPKKIFMLKPDGKLSEIVNSAEPESQAIVGAMDPELVESIRKGVPYFLGTDDKVIYLARTTSKYRSRGVSILSRVVKDLLYKGKLRLLQLAFCDRHSRPLKIIKLGSESKGWLPSTSQFETFKQLFNSTINDPDPTLVWHFGISVDYVGTQEKIMNLIQEFDWIDKQVMAGLFVNEDMIYGNSPASVRDNISVRILMLRYNDLREKIERFLTTHVFLPMARARRMYKNEKLAKEMEKNMYVYASKHNKKIGANPFENNNIFVEANSAYGIEAYDIPKPIWKKINVFNNTQEQQLILNLEEKGKLPFDIVLESLGFDPSIIAQKLKEQESTVFDPVFKQIREEMAKSEEFREQVLNGKKYTEWNVPKAKTNKTSQPGSGSSPFGDSGLSDLGSGLDLGGGSDLLSGLGGGKGFEPPTPSMSGGLGGVTPPSGGEGGAPAAEIKPESLPSLPPMPESLKAPGSENAPGA